MKKWFERLKETLCGILPLFILFVVPTVAVIVVWIMCNWDDIPLILSRIAVIGNGSWIIGILFILFALIGLINAFAAFMMWAKAFLDWLNRKAKSSIWFWLAIIVVTFGWYALFRLIKLL